MTFWSGFESFSPHKRCPGERDRRGKRRGRPGTRNQDEAALLVVGEGKLEQALDKAELKAEKHVAKELDVLWKDVDKAVREAAKEVG